MVLFRVEDRRGVRYGEDFRLQLDAFAKRFFIFLNTIIASYKSDITRQSVHYVLHIILLASRTSAHWIVSRFDSLIRINRSFAHRAAVTSREAEKHLIEMLAHKKNTALSDTEKRKRKSDAVGMRL